MFELLRDKFGKPLRAEYVDNGIEVSRTNPHTGNLNRMTIPNMIMQDLIEYFDPRISNGDKYHYLSYEESEFLDTGIVH